MAGRADRREVVVVIAAAFGGRHYMIDFASERSAQVAAIVVTLKNSLPRNRPFRR